MSKELFLSPEQKLARVEAIVRDYPEVAGFQSYEYLNSNVQDQKASFISGNQLALDLEYPDLTYDRIRVTTAATKEALKKLMPNERSPKTEALYDAIEYRYSEMSLIGLAVDMHNPALSGAERAQVREWFKATSEALYGVPDKKIFSSLANKHILRAIKQPLPDGVVDAIGLRNGLVSRLGTIDRDQSGLFRPSQERINHLGQLVDERFGYLLKPIIREKLYDVPAIVEVFEEALQKLGAIELGWQVKVVPGSFVLAISAHQKEAQVGANREPLRGLELRGKTLHEIGVHALRSINAERAGWLSAQYGQDGYLDFEEALGTALEDADQGKFEDHGENHYLVAGLAYGLDNHQPRDFREVYEIIWRTEALKSITEERNISEAQLEKAKSKAFTACMIFFRGTSTTEKGLVYLKDLAYFRGQELAWSVLENVYTQEDFDLLFAGKLDLTKPDHKLIAEDIVRKLKPA